MARHTLIAIGFIAILVASPFVWVLSGMHSVMASCMSPDGMDAYYIKHPPAISPIFIGVTISLVVFSFLIALLWVGRGFYLKRRLLKGGFSMTTFLVLMYFGMTLTSIYLTELFGKIIVALSNLYGWVGSSPTQGPVFILVTLLFFTYLVYKIPAASIKNDFPTAGRNALRTIMVAAMAFAIITTNWVRVAKAFTETCPTYLIPGAVYQMHLTTLATRSTLALGGLTILMFVCNFVLQKFSGIVAEM